MLGRVWPNIAAAGRWWLRAEGSKGQREKIKKGKVNFTETGMLEIRPAENTKPGDHQNKKKSEKNPPKMTINYLNMKNHRVVLCEQAVPASQTPVWVDYYTANYCTYLCFSSGHKTVANRSQMMYFLTLTKCFCCLNLTKLQAFSSC